MIPAAVVLCEVPSEPTVGVDQGCGLRRLGLVSLLVDDEAVHHVREALDVGGTFVGHVGDHVSECEFFVVLVVVWGQDDVQSGDAHLLLDLRVDEETDLEGCFELVPVGQEDGGLFLVGEGRPSKWQKVPVSGWSRKSVSMSRVKTSVRR
ncbi:hypothetical protein R1T08_16395 [Streptomyces sp. SBC-4]|nr:hypothetical protein [Streptomyces sp. SBC-4]MDV5145745.1 hypothetical protein [Streptomyces sp. SBC-4]